MTLCLKTEPIDASHSQPPLPSLPSLSELESRMQVLRVSALEENKTGETFSQRAEWFYQRRPLILSLCQDLYDGYTTLLNRDNHAKPQNPKHISHDNDSDTSSEVTSILSQITTCDKHKIKELVSQLVTANTEKDTARDELRRGEQKYREASTTIELLKKLVTLLDMEKEVAVEETVNLGYKLTSLLEENRELASEALFMRKEAVRLARCVLKMRDDHFHEMCVLQNQVYSLQSASSTRECVYENETSPRCFGLDKSRSKKRKVSETRSECGEKKKKKSKWLKRLNPFVKSSVSPSPALFHRPAQ